MTSKFFPPAAATASGLCLLALAASSLFGQSPSPAVKPKFGNLRLWNMQPIGSPALELVITGADPQGRVLQNAQPVNYYAGYNKLPPGTYPVKVCRVGEHDTPIKTFNVLLHNNSYITILVSQPPTGPVTAEMIDDTPDPTKPPINRLTVRQFCPNIHVQVTAPGHPSTDMIEAGHAQTLDGLPKGQVQVAMRATLANGTVRTWNTEADFRTSRHASLLVFADPYGRIRPRVSVDGPSPDEEDAAAAEAAAAAPSTHTP